MPEMQRMVPRLTIADENTRLFTATHATLAIPAPLSLVDTISLMPGQGEHQRVTSALKLWESDTHFRHLIISGTNKTETKQPQLTLKRLQQSPYRLHRLEGVLTQVDAIHTRNQTDWIIEQALQHDVSSIALYVVHWHLPRAYRSLIKSMLNAGIRIPIFPVVIGSPPRQLVPDMQVSVEVASAGEAHRIHTYEQIGEIASYDELMEYIDWLWIQRTVPIQSKD